MIYQAYVDGSYLEGKVGYGAVLLQDKIVLQEFSGAVTEHTESRQVAGELVAVITIMDYCAQHNISEVDIFYDYKGIEQWATGRWKTNKPLTQQYAATVRKSSVKVRWHKVKSHSGNEWNDRADELAKQGTGVEIGSASGESPQKEVIMLAALGDAFAAHLSNQEIEARCDGVKNEQYARVIITKNNKRIGYFDLYDTKNRRLDPYLHGFKNKRLQTQIEALWAAYKQQL